MDEYLVIKPDSSFLLKLRGDSMIGEGIMVGDPEVPSVIIFKIFRHFADRIFKGVK
jgi:hypothetical protein